MAFRFGLFLLIPVPPEKYRDENVMLMMIMMIFAMVSMGMFFASMRILGNENSLFLLHAPGIWVLRIPFLYSGERSLSKIE